MANSFKSIWICLDRVFLCVEGGELRCWRSCFTFLPSVEGFFCCTNFLFWRLTAQLSSTMPSLAHDGSPRIAGPSVSAMYLQVCRWFATYFPLGVQSIVVSRCSKRGYFGSIVSCQVHHGWLQFSWWTIRIDMSGQQLGKCSQWHDITTHTSVNLALESHKLIWSNLSRHLDRLQRLQLLSLSEPSDISIVLGSASLLLCLVVSHSLWCGVCRTTATTPTSSQWGSASVSTSLTFLCFPPLFVVFGSLVLESFWPTLAFGLPVSQFSTSLVLVIPYWIWRSARWVGLHTVSTWVHTVC